MVRENKRSHCPINYALEVFGDRWTLLIIRDLMFKGKHHYGEFLQSEEKIATNILSSRLEMLENARIIKKSADPDHSSKIIYSLTDKGIDLVPVLVEVIKWSAKYDSNTAADVKFVNKAKRDGEGLVADVRDRLKSKS